MGSEVQPLIFHGKPVEFIAHVLESNEKVTDKRENLPITCMEANFLRVKRKEMNTWPIRSSLSFSMSSRGVKAISMSSCVNSGCRSARRSSSRKHLQRKCSYERMHLSQLFNKIFSLHLSQNDIVFIPSGLGIIRGCTNSSAGDWSPVKSMPISLNKSTYISSPQIAWPTDQLARNRKCYKLSWHQRSKWGSEKWEVHRVLKIHLAIW